MQQGGVPRSRGCGSARTRLRPTQVSFNTASVSDGVAAISATAFDTSGHVSSPVGSTITIDNADPTLTVTSGPNGGAFKAGTTQSWAFTASDTNSVTVQCSVVVDGQLPSYAPCTSGSTGHTVTGLPEGDHRFFVRATDGAGNTTEQERTFTIDATAPQTILDKKPGDRVVTTRLRASVRFEFHSNEAAAGFQCRLDSGSWLSCTSPKVYRLRKGEHVVRIRAVDQAGNRDATPTTTRFRVVRR